MGDARGRSPWVPGLAFRYHASTPVQARASSRCREHAPHARVAGVWGRGGLDREPPEARYLRGEGGGMNRPPPPPQPLGPPREPRHPPLVPTAPLARRPRPLRQPASNGHQAPPSPPVPSSSGTPGRRAARALLTVPSCDLRAIADGRSWLRASAHGQRQSVEVGKARRIDLQRYWSERWPGAGSNRRPSDFQGSHRRASRCDRTLAR